MRKLDAPWPPGFVHPSRAHSASPPTHGKHPSIKRYKYPPLFIRGSLLHKCLFYDSLLTMCWIRKEEGDHGLQCDIVDIFFLFFFCCFLYLIVATSCPPLRPWHGGHDQLSWLPWAQPIATTRGPNRAWYHALNIKKALIGPFFRDIPKNTTTSEKPTPGAPPHWQIYSKSCFLRLQVPSESNNPDHHVCSPSN